MSIVGKRSGAVAEGKGFPDSRIVGSLCDRKLTTWLSSIVIESIRDGDEELSEILVVAVTVEDATVVVAILEAAVVVVKMRRLLI